MRKWYDIKASAEDAEVYLYGYIGKDSWDDDATSAAEFIKEIEAYSSVPLKVRINSGGGSVFDGVAIANAIKRRTAETTTCIDALAASAASVIAMAGDWIVIAEGAQIMIHKAWTYGAGNADELRQTATALDSIDAELALIYSKRTGKTEAECAELMAKEDWIGTARALAEGWVDEIDEGESTRKAACIDEITLRHMQGRIPESVLASFEADDTDKPITDPEAQGADGAEAQGAEAGEEKSEEELEPQTRVVVLASGIYEIKEQQ